MIRAHCRCACELKEHTALGPPFRPLVPILSTTPFDLLGLVQQPLCEALATVVDEAPEHSKRDGLGLAQGFSELGDVCLVVGLLCRQRVCLVLVFLQRICALL